MTVLAGLTLQVDVDLTKLRSQLGAIKAALDPLNASMKDFAASVKTVGAGAGKTAEDIEKLRRRKSEATATTANLGRAVRELTTSLLGSSIPAIALGTALGNILTQAVSRLILAIADSITQFTRLQNQLTEIDGIAGQASNSFNLIQQVAQNSVKSLNDLTQSYANLARQVFGTRVSVDEANQIFREYETRLANIQQKSISGAFTQALTAFGGVISKLDEMLHISEVIIGAIGLVRDAFEWLRSKVAGDRPPVRSRAELEQELVAATNRLEEFQNQLRFAQRAAGDIMTREVTSLSLLVAFNMSLVQRLTTQIAEADTVTAEQRTRQLNTVRDIQANLAQEIMVSRAVTQEQQVLNRMFQITNQLRTVGIDLARDALLQSALELQVRRAIAAQQFQGLRRQLDPIATDREEHEQRLANLESFHSAQLALLRRSLEQEQITREEFAQREILLANEIGELVNAERARRQNEVLITEMRGSQMLLSQMQTTAGHAIEFLNIFGSKNKAAAIAAVVIGKGMAIAQTIQQGILASTAALAPPPIGLGPVAGAPLSAAIKALTAVNVGLIAATGIGQIAGIASGQSLGSGSGSSTGTPPTDQDGTAPLRVVIEEVDPAALITGRSLNNLIAAINKQAENGHLIIASKLIEQY